MRRRPILLLLTAAAALTTASKGFASSATHPPASSSVDALASTVMSKLVAENFRGALEGMHEPASWDVARAAMDRQKMSEHLAALSKEFGRISAPRVDASVSFYEFQIAGADVPYWQSLPNFGFDSRLVYRVKFSKVGPGVVALGFTRASGSWELRSVSLGLDRARPQSKEAALRIGRTFLTRFDPKMSKDALDKALAVLLAQEPN